MQRASFYPHPAISGSLAKQHQILILMYCQLILIGSLKHSNTNLIMLKHINTQSKTAETHHIKTRAVHKTKF